MSQAMDGGDVKASSIIVGNIPLLQIPQYEQKKPKNLDSIDACILAYYYSALTNLFCQAFIASAERIASDDAIQQVIQASNADFQMLDAHLDSCDPAEICASPNSDLYEQIRDTWKAQVEG